MHIFISNLGFYLHLQVDVYLNRVLSLFPQHNFINQWLVCLLGFSVVLWGFYCLLGVFFYCLVGFVLCVVFDLCFCAVWCREYKREAWETECMSWMTLFLFLDQVFIFIFSLHTSRAKFATLIICRGAFVYTNFHFTGLYKMVKILLWLKLGSIFK